MDIVKNLKEAAEECLKQLKTIDAKVSAAEGALSFLESKKAVLTAELKDLESKKEAVMQAVGTAELESKKTIDARLQDLSVREVTALMDRADLKTKMYQTDSARADMEQSKKRYDDLYSEFEIRLKELNDKKQAVADILK